MITERSQNTKDQLPKRKTKKNQLNHIPSNVYDTLPLLNFNQNTKQIFLYETI